MISSLSHSVQYSNILPNRVTTAANSVRSCSPRGLNGITSRPNFLDCNQAAFIYVLNFSSKGRRR